MRPEFVEQLYTEYLKVTKDPQAAATLTLAAAIGALAKSTAGLSEDMLEHSICMGIRHGIFGSGESRSITELGGDIAKAIEEHP